MTSPLAPNVFASDVGDLLEGATRIGNRLVREALWSGSSCTWMVRVVEAAYTKHWVSRPATDQLYNGAAGIGLFLTELAARVQHPEYLAAAAGAFRHATAQHTNARPGFYSGTAGIAYAVGRFGSLTGSNEFIESSRDLIRSLERLPMSESGYDLVSGAAGCIIGLLLYARHHDMPAAVELAARFGDHLIDTARHWPFGWSWGKSRTGEVRDLTGLSHGASGCGLALLELFSATGESRFRFASEQAFDYERGCFLTAQENWPRYANYEVQMLVGTHQYDELARRVRVRDPELLWREQSQVAWCHGAPGIGLARLRAYEITGDPRCWNEALIAIQTSLRARTIVHDRSLCHGLAGLDVLLVEGARVLQHPEWRNIALQQATADVRRFELCGIEWPSGSMGGAHDLALLVGDAGIGYYLLSLATESVPPILLLQTNPPSVPPESARPPTLGALPSRDDHTLRRVEMERFFGRSMKRFKLLRPDFVPLDVLAGARRVSPSAEDISAIIDALLASEDLQQHRMLLDDASRLDRASLALVHAGRDFAEAILDDISRPSFATIDWTTATIRLNPRVVLTFEDFDWDDWIKTGSVGIPARLTHRVNYVLYRIEERVVIRAIPAFAQLVLAAASERADIEELSRRVEVDVGIGSSSHSLLREKTLAQVQSAFRAGLLDANTPDRPSVRLSQNDWA